MRRRRELIAICVVFFLLAEPALAAHSLIPAGTNFQIGGKVMLSETNKFENCKIVMVGTTSPPETKSVAAKITGATVESKKRQCSTLSFTNFPYNVVINSHIGGQVENIIFIVSGRACELAPVPITISKKGVWSFRLTGDCDFVGTFQSYPPVTIGK